ncbi:MAG TPA: hypothetical protein VN371_09070 [Chlorobaculum sp.]|nr:hypothetical protein [Chlorobaculum sp.]
MPILKGFDSFQDEPEKSLCPDKYFCETASQVHHLACGFIICLSLEQKFFHVSIPGERDLAHLTVESVWEGSGGEVLVVEFRELISGGRD